MNTIKKLGFLLIGMIISSFLFAATINGWIDIPEMAVSANPPAGWWRTYFKSDGKMYKRSSAGLETPFAELYGAIITDSSTARTLSASDNGVVIVFTSNSAVTVTAPVLAPGFNCLLVQRGTGTITVLASGTTLYSEGAKVASNAHNAIMTVLYTASAEIQLGGSLK